ncbi:MAG TPA: hypothetical protein VIZ28_07765 [Chitinophagaceae bacterium]
MIKILILLLPASFFAVAMTFPYFSFSQNVGIGTATPTGKLQVNHRSNVTTPGLLMMDSTISRSGNIRFRSINTAKYVELWGYSGNNLWSAEQYLDVESDSTIIATFRGNGRVGINTLNPAERLDVNGNINLSGVLKVNGNAGTTGQVLTSNGTGDPQWKNTAYNNNARFAATIPVTTGTDDLTYSAIYNLNPADVTISGSALTINKTGLWHLEGYIIYSISWSAAPFAQAFSASFTVDGVTYVMISEAPLDRNPVVISSATYGRTLHFSHDVYVSAPATVSIFRGINYNAGGNTISSRSTNGVISGFLISE